MPFLPTRTDDEQARITADYQIDGPHMRAKRVPGKNVFKYLRAMSREFGRLEQYLRDANDGRLITRVTTFLSEWEKAAGIPDANFPAIGTEEERRRHVVTKLASEGVSTAADLEWLCSLMGFKVTVYPGYHFILNPDPRITFPIGPAGEREARFTVVFEVNFAQSVPDAVPNLFPVPFPWEFRSNNYNIIQDFMLDIIPSNCNAKWIVAPIDNPGYGYFPYGISPYGL